MQSWDSILFCLTFVYMWKTSIAQGNVSTIWSRYVLQKKGSNVLVTDADGTNIDDCDGCISLFDEFLTLSVERYCIVIGGISAVSADWQLSNCSSANDYICEIQYGGLTLFDFIAIGCGVFLFISFIVVITVDIVKNGGTPDPQNKQLVQP